MLPGEVKDHVKVSKESVSAPDYSLGLMWSPLFLAIQKATQQTSNPQNFRKQNVCFPVSHNHDFIPVVVGKIF